MSFFSIVIVCRNEAAVIADTLRQLQGLSDDILVYDTGSTDGTPELVRSFPVRLEQGPWEGFGQTKRKANSMARYDWILSLDADEAPDDTLRQSLLQWKPESEQVVYDLAYRNFIGSHPLRYGEWGGDHHIRLFHRGRVNWDDAPVHETLQLPSGTRVKKLKGLVLHRTVRDLPGYAEKMLRYAWLNAEKYYRQGKKAAVYRLWFSPAFTFMHYYLLKRGFLDGYPGYLCARMTAYYTFLKYARLRELWQQLDRDKARRTSPIVHRT